MKLFRKLRSDPIISTENMYTIISYYDQEQNSFTCDFKNTRLKDKISSTE